MSRSKKIFTAFAIAFFVFLVFTVYDISRRTTFPGSRHPKKDTVMQKGTPKGDTSKRALSPNSAVHHP